MGARWEGDRNWRLENSGERKDIHQETRPSGVSSGWYGTCADGTAQCDVRAHLGRGP